MTPTPPGDSEQEDLVTDLSAKAGAFTPGVLPLTVLPEGGTHPHVSHPEQQAHRL